MKIKFRIWDGHKMKYPKTEEGIAPVSFFALGEDLGRSRLSNGEVMQFTGVYDIDGKEIYMGDICSNEVAKWIVVFDRGCFSAKMVGRESSIHLALRVVVGLRVIGNVYEDLEKLKNT